MGVQLRGEYNPEGIQRGVELNLYKGPPRKDPLTAEEVEKEEIRLRKRARIIFSRARHSLMSMTRYFLEPRE